MFSFPVFLLCFGGWFWDGAQRGPCGTGVCRACSWQHWQEEVLRSCWCLIPGIALSLLALSRGSLEEVSPYPSLPAQGFITSAQLQSWEGWLVAGKQLRPPGEAEAQRQQQGTVRGQSREGERLTGSFC